MKLSAFWKLIAVGTMPIAIMPLPSEQATAATGRRRCVDVTIDSLWNHPVEFSNRRICVVGFLGRMVPFGEDSPKLFATAEEAETNSSEHYITIGVRMTIPSQEMLSRHSVQPLRVEGIFGYDPRCWPQGNQPVAEYTCFPSRPMRLARAKITFLGSR